VSKPVAQQLRLDLRSEPPKGAEDFVVSPSNLDAVRMVEAWPHWRAGCLVLVGPADCGKTHLAGVWRERVGAVEAAAQPLAALVGRPVLMEDADGGFDDERLFHLIEMAAQSGGGLLLTARRPPVEWLTRLPDLRSRLNALPVAEISAPDDTVLEALLRRFFDARHITPPADLFAYLLPRMTRSAPAAKALVARIDDEALVRGVAVSRALARQILEIDAETGELFP
jgi:chromosomal replication initiation ATPase DnaA